MNEMTITLNHDAQQVINTIMEQCNLSVEDSINKAIMTYDDNLIKIINVIPKYNKEQINMIIPILNKYGITLEYTNRPDKHIKMFCDQADIINRPVTDVYNEYVTFCCDNSHVPESQLYFARVVNKYIGTYSKTKKVSGKAVKVYGVN